MKINDVVIFDENHILSNHLGIIRNINYLNKDIRYQIEIPTLDNKALFVFIMHNDCLIKKIGNLGGK